MTKPAKKNNDKLLELLAESAPIGKGGTPKSVIKPFPKEITQYFSSQKTKVPTIEEITIEELFNIAAIDIQRGTAKRLGKNRKYLTNDVSYVMETGRMFTAVQYPDGSKDLVDGNTRAMNYYNEIIRCIETGEPPRFEIPATVTLVTHKQNSKEEAMILYLTFDNVNASEKSIDKMEGVKDVLGIKFEKEYMDKVNYKTGLDVASSKMTGVYIEKIPNLEYGLMKEFKPELEYLDEHSNFENSPVGGDDIAVLAAMLRKFRCSHVMKQKIITLANKVFSPDGSGIIIMPNGGKNAAAMLRDEYYNSKATRRFPRRSCSRSALMGFWVHYLNESDNDKILPRATNKNDNMLQDIGNDFLGS